MLRKRKRTRKNRLAKGKGKGEERKRDRSSRSLFWRNGVFSSSRGNREVIIFFRDRSLKKKERERQKIAPCHSYFRNRRAISSLRYLCPFHIHVSPTPSLFLSIYPPSYLSSILTPPSLSSIILAELDMNNRIYFDHAIFPRSSLAILTNNRKISTIFFTCKWQSDTLLFKEKAPLCAEIFE